MPVSTPIYQALDEWIARESIPFSIDSPSDLNTAVDKMVACLGDSIELLGFGEALHGSEEILLLRNRLFQRLVESHGYVAIAIESSFPRSSAANDYINHRGSASFDEVQNTGFSHGFGQLEANRELIEWMRQYNADPANHKKLHFYGFDQPAVIAGPASPRQVLNFALDYLTAIDSAIAQPHRDRIDPLLGQDASWENPMAWRDPATSADLLSSAAALQIETEDLISKLHARRPEWAAATDEGRYLEALHHAQITRQLLNFFVALARSSDYGESLGIRDALMADNLAYIVDRERSRGKVFAFAHNKHLQRGQAQWQLGPAIYKWWPAGSHVNEAFGPRYAVIGTAVGVSEANGIAPPEPTTLEARLTAAPGPTRFIPTHHAQGLPTSEIAKLPIRTGSTKNPTYFALTPESFTDFNWLATIDSTTYNRGGRALP